MAQLPAFSFPHSGYAFMLTCLITNAPTHLWSSLSLASFLVLYRVAITRGALINNALLFGGYVLLVDRYRLNPKGNAKRRYPGFIYCSKQP